MKKDDFLNSLLARTRENAAQMDADLTARLQVFGAALVCDSSGFTRITREKGILHFLALLMQSYELSIPLIGKHNGVLLKNEADNLIALFNSPTDAARAAIEMQQSHALRNAKVEEDEQFFISIGLDYGAFLRLEDDAFGDTINIAYKLGEDLAKKSEILASRDFVQNLPSEIERTFAGVQEVGHLDAEIYRIEYSCD
jgi:class 3 adenylate cyclase